MTRFLYLISPNKINKKFYKDLKDVLASNKKNKKIPGKISKKIYPKFNRAIFFDVSQNSWHSVMGPKKKITRNSMAVYYLINPIRKNFSERKKAFYAPTEKQKNNKKILKFISLRSNPKHFSKVYKTK